MLETVAGKHRANDIASLVQNWENVKKMKESALNSDGSAAAEQEKYMQSMQGHLDQLSASWQAFSATTMDSGFLNGIIDGGRAAVEVFTGLIDKVGVLPTLLGVVSGALSFKNTGVFTLKKDVDDIIPRLQILNNDVKDLPKVFKYASDSVKSFFGKDVSSSDFSKKHDETFSKVAEKIENSKGAIASFNKKISEGIAPIQAWETCFADADETIKKLVKRQVDLGNAGKGITEEQIKKIANLNAVTQAAYDKSLSSKKSLIDRFNNADELKKMGVSQLEYAEAVKKTDKYMGNHLLTVAKQNEQITAQKKALTESGKAIDGTQFKTAEASMAGYTKTLVGAKVATFGLQVASMALNAALSMGIGMLVSAAIEGIMSYINRAEELADKVEEVTTKHKQQSEELKKNKSNFQDLAESYAQLSKGVDSNTGKNISLMPEEYEEYQSVVNQIADMTPSLVAGYDSQGNAILNCAGNVDTLTKAYNDLIVAENNSLLNGDGKDYKGLSDILDDFQNDYKDIEKNYGSNSDKLGSDDTSVLEKILGDSDITDDKVGEYTDKVAGSMHKITQAIKKEAQAQNVELSNVETPGDLANRWDSSKYIAEMRKQHPEVVKAVMEDYSSEFESAMDTATQETREAINAYFENAFLSGDYKNIDEKTQTILSSVANSLNGEAVKNIIGDKTGEEAKQAVISWSNNLLSAFDGLDTSVRDKITSAFDLSGEFSNGELSFGEYKKQLEEAEKLIDGLNVDDNTKNQLKLSLNIDEVNKQYNDLKNRLTSDDKIKMEPKLADDFINSLTSSELSAAQELIINGSIDWKDKSPDDIKKEIQDLAKISEALNFSLDIDAESDKIDNINTALKESVSAAGLSTESFESLKSQFASLDSYDPAKLFEKTSNGIHLNREELSKLQKEYANTNLEKANSSMETLKKAYADVTEKIRTCSNESERSSLLAQQMSYADQIEALSEMTAQYEGLTSAYNNWVNAQSSGEEGDVYDDVLSKLESAKELKEKGLVGTNEFAAAVEYMSGKDTSTMNVDEIEAAYDKALPKAQRYFTESSDGVSNLLTDLSKLNKEYAHMNENGEWEVNMSADDIKKAAEELGISADMIDDVLAKGSDYGLDIDYESVYDAAESLETLRTEAESANDKLKDLGKTDLTFSFESTNAEDLENQIKNATKMAEQFKNSDGTWNMNIEGAAEAQQVLRTLIMQKQEVTKPAFMNVSVATIGDENLGHVIQAMEQIQTYKNLYEIQIAVGADTSDTQAKIGEVISKLQSLKNENPQIFADLGLDTSEFNDALNTLHGNVEAGVELDQGALATVQSALQGVNAEVLANVGLGDTSAVDSYVNGEKTANGKVNWSNDSSAVDAFASQTHTSTGTVTWGNDTSAVKTSFTATGTITWSGSGGPSNGTANPKGYKASFASASANESAFANGTTGKAFKQGNWGTNKDGVALGGELGQELVVRDGRYFTIGDDGAEFFNYKRGDIIFNAGQTKELFEKGKITGGQTRGRALAEGTAFVGGVSGGGKLRGSSSSSKKKSSSSSSKSSSSGSKSSSSSKSSSNNSSSNASEEEDKFEEQLDWIEILIDRIERAISRLDLKATSIFKGWTERTSALNDQISQTTREIDIQQQAYNRYIQEANKVGLSENYASRVRDGTIDIETITDEDLNDKIKDYQTWYEKALDCQDAIDELRESEAKLYQQRFENVSTKYEGALGVIQHEKDMLDEFVSQTEEKGYIVSTKYYEALSKNAQQNITKLEQQKAEMLKEFQNAMSSGTITKYSEAWYSFVNDIDEVTKSIEELKTSTLEYANSIREIKFDIFDKMQDQISNVADEANFLIDLMDNKKLFEDNGQLTDEGMATMGLHGSNYNVYMYQADKYAEELKRIQAELNQDPYNQNLIDRRQELLEAQQEAIRNAEDEKNAIKDLVEEGIDKELSSLDELINKYEDALDSQKD